MNRRRTVTASLLLGLLGAFVVLFASAAPQAASGVADVDPHKAFGSKTAPVIMEVFSDFQCPACKTLFISTNRQLMENYVSTGKAMTNAIMRGSTSTSTGSTPMVRSASISSRIFIEPSSAV